MSRIEHYRQAYEYEKDCNRKMLAMRDSVPPAVQSDARFQQALTLVGHLAACRENWLDRIEGNSRNPAAWWDAQCDAATLPARFAALHTRWTVYFARLDDGLLAQDFEFMEGEDGPFRLPVEVQVEQLAGHASCHRGQVALLVTQLGGETQDTDYADWWWANHMNTSSDECQDFTQTLTIAAPCETVFDALATVNGPKGWWTVLVSGSAETGGSLRFEFPRVEGHALMHVDHAISASSVQWTCVECTLVPDWVNTVIVFDLTRCTADTCELNFRHHGLTPALECFDMCSVGWNTFLPSLKSYAETDKGWPNAEH